MGPHRSNYLLSHLDVLEAESVHIKFNRMRSM
jgi:hypothetical protein